MGGMTNASIRAGPNDNEHEVEAARSIDEILSSDEDEDPAGGDG